MYLYNYYHKLPLGKKIYLFIFFKTLKKFIGLLSEKKNYH